MNKVHSIPGAAETNVQHDQSSKPTKIIYILTTGHSGSTLLDMMLGGHPGAISVGELAFNSEFLNVDRKCSCSAESLLDCAHWMRVNRILARQSRSIRDLSLMGDGRCEDNEMFYRAICGAANAEFIVESTKSVGRLRKISECPGLDLHVVLLLRRASAVVASNVRRGRSMVRCTFVHLINMASKTHLSRGWRCSVVHYEDFVRDPDKEIGRILRRAGIQGEWSDAGWRTKQYHLSGGNPIRFKSEHILKLDDRWKTELSAFDKIVINCIVNRLTMWFTTGVFVVVRTLKNKLSAHYVLTQMRSGNS